MHIHLAKMQKYLLLKDTLSEFYAMIAIRSFGLSMVNIFLPIFMFTLRNSFMDLISFVFFTYLTTIILYPFAGKLASKVGPAHSMLLSVPFTILFFGSLYFFNPLTIEIPLLAIIYGISQAIFWIAFDLEFASISRDDDVESEFSFSQAIYIVSTLVGPIIGGFTIAFLGFEILFALIIILVLFGQLCLLLSKDNKTTYPFSFRDIFNKKNFKTTLPFIGYGGVALITMWFWPLWVFLIVPNYIQLGFLSAIVTFTTAIIYVVISRKGKKISEKKLSNIGCVFHCISIGLRGFVFNIAGVIFVWVFAAIFWPIFDAPFGSIMFENAKKSNRLEFFVSREMGLFTGRMIILFVIFAFAINPTAGIFAGMISAAILGLLQLLV